ncbi:MAG: GGDEF domain-containing protein [Planctomycetota bacterium]
MTSPILDRILESSRLPSLPTIALEIIELVQRPDVSIPEIAETLQQDPALASKVLKTVNSSFYAQTSAVSSVSQALVVMGLRSVKTLALGFSLVGNLQEISADEFAELGFWRRSLFAATAAKRIAEAIEFPQQEECFLGALMQDLGMLAMQQTLGEEYAVIVQAAGNEHNKLRRYERESMEVDHAVVGGVLAEKWHLPEVLAEPIRYHETPDEAPAPLRKLVRVIAAGSRVAEHYNDPDNPEHIEDYFRCMQQWFNLSADESRPIVDDLMGPTREMQRLFELPTGELGDPAYIMAKAQEAMENISLESQAEIHQLEAANQRLNAEVNTDTLTGVANRKHFNEYITESFVASGAHRPLSVMFLDADHFKQFNDTYGHATGDRVLIELGRILRELFDKPCLPCRYGGEEFSVILPGVDRKEAAVRAETLRQAIEATTVPSDKGEALKVTASIGVACHDGSVFRHPDQLVKAADKAVYAAKGSGRNCVRVFTPRPANTAA